MAEAPILSSTSRFFCHKCTQEIFPLLPEYICPRCQSGFVEALQARSDYNRYIVAITEVDESEDDGDPVSQFPELWNILQAFRRLEPERYNAGSNESQQTGGITQNASQAGPSSRRLSEPISQLRDRRRLPQSDQMRHAGLLEQFLVASLAENTGFVANAGLPVFLNLHGNPGDYAWGRGGWNAVITQLMNQLDGTGPPPLSRDKIEEIPSVNILQEQVDKCLQCTVCMEDFKVDEAVKRLSCQHHFHSGCIIPWLELHGTCPICRKLLNDESNCPEPTPADNNSSTSSVSSSETGSVLSSTSSSSSYTNLLQRSTNVSTSSSTSSGSSSNNQLPSVYDFTEEFD